MCSDLESLTNMLIELIIPPLLSLFYMNGRPAGLQEDKVVSVVVFSLLWM